MMIMFFFNSFSKTLDILELYSKHLENHKFGILVVLFTNLIKICSVNISVIPAHKML